MDGIKVAYIKYKDRPIVGELVKLESYKVEEYGEDYTYYSVTIRAGGAINNLEHVELRHILFLADYVQFRPDTEKLRGHFKTCGGVWGTIKSIAQSTFYKDGYDIDVIYKDLTEASYRGYSLEDLRLYNAYAVYNKFG